MSNSSLVKIILLRPAKLNTLTFTRYHPSRMNSKYSYFQKNTQTLIFIMFLLKTQQKSLLRCTQAHWENFQRIFTEFWLIRIFSTLRQRSKRELAREFNCFCPVSIWSLILKKPLMTNKFPVDCDNFFIKLKNLEQFSNSNYLITRLSAMVSVRLRWILLYHLDLVL